MTTTLRRPESAGLNGSPHPLPPKSPAPPGTLRRNRPRIALGLIVSALCILGVVSVVGRNADRQQAVALATDLPAGSIIDSDDLIVVDLPADSPLPSLPAIDRASVVGQSTTVSLPKGTLLQPAMLTDEPRVPDDMALVGVVLDPGQYPTDVSIGDTVQLVRTGSPVATEAEPVSNLGSGEVRQLEEPPTGGKALVASLLVPTASADAIAAAGADGRIALVVVGSR